MLALLFSKLSWPQVCLAITSKLWGFLVSLDVPGWSSFYLTQRFQMMGKWKNQSNKHKIEEIVKVPDFILKC